MAADCHHVPWQAFMKELNDDKAPVLKSNVGSVAGISRKYGATVNSAKILVLSGARFTSVAKGGAKTVTAEDAESEQAKLAADVRAKLKVIDSHLASEAGVEVVHAEAKKGSRGALKANAVGLAKNALEAAKETKYKPVGGDAFRRTEEMIKYAKLGRGRVAPPLDHALQANAERNVQSRRASTGVGRRASTLGGGGGGDRKASVAAGDANAAGDEIAGKLRRASQLMASSS